MTLPLLRSRIRASISNASLQAALDGNALRRVSGRDAAFESLPDWRERRKRAHAVRADVIEHLDEYVDQFIANAARNGVIVHRAQDAATAVSIILQIAQSSAPPGRQALIAKSKSMVSEEIELNNALERRGIKVVETDLGEYIVQLRGEKPAHLITPAVHLRRFEVGQLFHDKLGLPYTEDIPTLTAAARRLLRDVFLTADVGISGVNFGVAETGTVVTVTNEGNGRMCTTLPPAHIALMGMERLVPSLQDLALMLSLLPRSATGQKLTVYTQLINSPRRPGEVDGARERHLVLVDNGRSRLRSSPLKEALYCIRCGACLNVCPVFREIGGHAYVGSDGSIAPYPGPIGSIVSPGLLGLQQFGHLAQASSLCGACKDACPVDIDLPRLLTRVRAGGSEGTSSERGVGLSHLSRFGLHLYGIIGSSPRLFTISQFFGGLATRILSTSSDWFRIPALTGWGYSKDFPRVASKSFRQRFQPSEPLPEAQPAPPAISPPPAAVQENALPLVEKFTREAEALGVVVRRVAAAHLSETLINDLKQAGAAEAMAWDPIEGLDRSRLTAAGIALTGEPDPLLKVGITGAAAGIAETGTLLITSGPGRPLTASLLPDVHIAVLPASLILGSLEEALSRPDIPAASASVLITGPSRTADIEMALTIGVHGPKQVVIYIVE
ncbi:MAG TPA: LUD domain-containing protein [Anaerolineales bacterium]|nr:LUD domain-containing protein [Anaerolineales bacterium]